MSEEYNVTKIGSMIDPDKILEELGDEKELFKLQLPTQEDQIMLFRAQITELRRQIGEIKKILRENGIQ